jgi:hypothetical protein
MVVQTPELYKIVWLTSRCSHSNTGKNPRSRNCERFAIEKCLRSLMKRMKSSAAVVGKEPFLLHMCIGKSVYSVVFTYSGNIYFFPLFSLLWSSLPYWSTGLIAQFLDISQAVGLLGRVISSSQDLYLNTGTH